jgi:NADPH:quinone reductase-like Zn-dependent oxidoreductase
MKAYQIQTPDGIDGLKQVDLPDPKPGSGQILVRVRATSLNYRDTAVVSGMYPGQTLPIIPLSDGAGEVVEIGSGVTRVKVGDRVAGIFFQDWLSGRLTREKVKSALGGAIDGMLAELVVLNQEGVVLLPDYLSYEAGATLPCAAVTAWQALVTRGTLAAGETVLLLGTGGVSIFALQFAKILGAKIVITSSSDEKLERARSMGAHATINYKTHPDWQEQVLELTTGEGVDRVVEVGGAGTLDRSLQSVRIGGGVSLIGVLGGAGEVNHARILLKSIDVEGIYVGSREMFEAMLSAMNLHQIQPVIDRTFPFSEAKAAYQHLQSGSHFGKVVIQL